MSTITEIAEAVSRWASFGVKLPKDLAKAVADYELIKWTEVVRRPVFEIEGLTEKNVEARIGAYAQRLALGTSGGPGLSALERAKASALEDAATQVRNYAAHYLGDAIEQLQPKLAAVADAYCSAVEKLPDDLTSENLIKAGPVAVQAFSDAQALAKSIDRFDDWAVSATRLQSGRVDVVLRLLTPAHIGQLTRLEDAYATQASGVLAAVDPLWFTAARLGVPFEIHTGLEAQALRKVLSTAQPMFAN